MGRQTLAQGWGTRSGHTTKELSRRDFGKLAGVVAAAGLASAACGGGGGSGGNGDDTLLVWGSRDYYIPPDKFKGFEKDHPDINFKWDVQAGDDILQRLLRMRQAGQTMPDIIQDDTFLMKAYFDAGLLQPIDKQIDRWKKEDPELYKKILPITWDDTKFEGKYYGLSITANYDLLYYNKPWADEAGVKTPFETFNDLYDALEKMKKARPGKIPMSIQAKPDEGVTMLKSMLAAAGTPFTGAMPDLRDPSSLYVLDFFIRAQKAELIPKEAVAWGESETRAAFIRKDCGLVFDGLTTSGDFEDADLEFGKTLAATPLPVKTGEGQSGKTVTAPRTWALTIDADDPYQSSLVLRYLSTTKNLVEPALNGSVPMRQTEALKDPRLQKAWPFFDETFEKAYLESGSTPFGPKTGEIEEALVQMWDEIVAGTDSSAKQLANKYQPKLEKIHKS